MDVDVINSASSSDCHILRLPAEIRNTILEHVFERSGQPGYTSHCANGVVALDNDYYASANLESLFTCRQFYNDACLLAFHQTTFLVTNLFINIPERLARLRLKQIEAIRHIAFVADSRYFRNLMSWNFRPFGLPELQLDTLTMILHRSSAWHYLFDFTADIVKLLRQLQGVRKLIFVRNRAFVKGSFRSWCNRLIGLIMKVDHHERYLVQPPQLEETWWTWKFNEAPQTFSLEAAPPKPLVDEGTYMQQLLPLMEELRISIENDFEQRSV